MEVYQEETRKRSLIKEEARQKQHELYFHRLMNPGEAADFDPVLFIKKYLLKENGEPDKKKTLGVLQLHFSSKLHDLLRAIPELVVERGPRWELLAGWKKADVTAALKLLQQKHALELKEEECRRAAEEEEMRRLKEEEELKSLAPHHAFLKQIKDEGHKKENPSVANLRGLYIIKCREFKNSWGCESMTLRLNCVQRPG